MSSDVAISVKDLNKIYGVGSKNQKVALNNISLQVKKGSIFELLGPNGAGKSTFINILADLVRKTSGHIEIFGMSHDEKLKDVKKLMGIVPQELNIDPFFTPYELLEIQAGLFGVPKNNDDVKKFDDMLKNKDDLEAGETKKGKRKLKRRKRKEEKKKKKEAKKKAKEQAAKENTKKEKDE